MVWMIRSSGIDFQQGLGIFLVYTMSRPVLGHTQSPIQWVSEGKLAGA